MSGLPLRAGSLLALSTLGACAWSNPDNRPVWNAFEQRVVPAPGPSFYASLPATAPLGLGAILVDALVAHPLQVVDDAARDAADLWDPARLDFEQSYYTQLAGLPVRAAFTPVAFGGSWLGRCVFDLPPHEPDLSEAEQLELLEQERRAAEQQQMAAQNSQMQAQQAQQAAMAASQAKQQELQMEAQLKQQEIQLKGQMDMQLMQMEHEMRKEIEMIKAQATLGFREDDQNFKEKLEVMKEDRKDNRLTQEQVQSNQDEDDVNINELPQ